MCKGYGLKFRGEAPVVMMETGSSGETDEGHVRRYFGISKGSAVKGIWKVWQGQGSGGGGCY